MAFKDLREYIAELESRGLLKRITTEVDCQLEITEITDRVSKMEGNKNVALLFENVKGYDMPPPASPVAVHPQPPAGISPPSAWKTQCHQKPLQSPMLSAAWHQSYSCL